MTDYYFKFTIRPVQHFIGQARKFIDLKNGSHLLSLIMNHAMEETKKLFPNTEFIYPYFKGTNSSKIVTSLPNVFIARIDVNGEQDRETIASLGEHIKQACTDFILEQYNKLQSAHKALIEKNLQVRNIVIEQLTHFLIVDWVILKDTTKDHDEYYLNNRLNQLFASVKNTYDAQDILFIQNPGKKCTVCGERNAIIFFDRQVQTTLAVHTKSYNPKDGKEGEGLCAVCFVKRQLGTSKNSISSLSDLTNSHLQEYFSKDTKYKELLDFFKSIQKNNREVAFDTQLLYSENTRTPKIFRKRSSVHITKEKLNQFNILQENVRTQLVSNQKHLYKYYALMLFDGDNMGKIVSGENLSSIERMNSLFSMQKDISKTLFKFTQDITTILKPKTQKQKLHELIYAGGDDVFIALNLSSALQTAWEIRKAYPKVLGSKKLPTASAGIIIAHYRTPLAYVLQKLREAEKTAKSKEGKNAVSITMLSHSGSAATCTMKWKYTDPVPLETIPFLNALIKELDTKMLSSTFIYQLRSEFSFLQQHMRNTQNDKEAFLLELKRLLHRSYSKGKEKEKMKKKFIETFMNGAKVLLENEPFSEFMNFLVLADSISRRAE